MRLSYPKLALPDSEETIAFRAVDQILRTDPQLSGITQTMLSWQGDLEDLWDPAVNLCPFLRISPGGMPSGWETEGQHKMPLSIAIEAAVVGSDSDQISNYWGCIRRALWPQGDTVRRDAIRTLTQQARITRPILSQPAYAVKVDDSAGGARITLAVGTLSLILLIDTP